MQKSDFVLNVLKSVETAERMKVEAMIANYQLTNESFEDTFDLIKYRLSSDNEGFKNAKFAVQAMMVISGMEQYYQEEEKTKKPQPKKQQSKTEFISNNVSVNIV